MFTRNISYRSFSFLFELLSPRMSLICSSIFNLFTVEKSLIKSYGGITNLLWRDLARCLARAKKSCQVVKLPSAKKYF